MNEQDYLCPKCDVEDVSSHMDICEKCKKEIKTKKETSELKVMVYFDGEGFMNEIRERRKELELETNEEELKELMKQIAYKFCQIK